MFYLLTINYLAYPGGQGKDRSHVEIDTIHRYKVGQSEDKLHARRQEIVHLDMRGILC